MVSIGVAGPDETVDLPWQPGRADYAPLERWLADTDAPKLLHDAKTQTKALAASGLALRGVVFDTLLAGWLLRPSGQEKTLAQIVDRYLQERLPEADPNQLVPDVGGGSPAPTHAWYVLRSAHVLKEGLDAGRCRCWSTSSCRPSRCSRGWRRRASPSTRSRSTR